MKRLSQVLSVVTILSTISLSMAATAETVFMVQLGTYRSESEAQNNWQGLVKQFPDLFQPLKYAPTEVTLPPDDFVYHRNQAGPIPTRSDAEAICSKLMEKNFECYVVESAMYAPASPPANAEASLPNEEAAATAAPGTPPPATVSAANEAATATTPAAPPSTAAAASTPSNLPTPAPLTPIEQMAQKPAETVPPSPPIQMSEAKPVQMTRQVAPMPAANTVQVMPEAPEDKATVRVGEAIPVPLSAPETPTVRMGKPGTKVTAKPRSTVFLGYPSQMTKNRYLWAELSAFQNEQAALGYWNTLRSRDETLPNGLRLRITRPYYLGTNASRNHLSLRVGPFENVGAIRRLCSHTRPEKLYCHAIKDLGSTVNMAGLRRESSQQTAQRRRQMQRYMLPPTTRFGGGNLYWLQLGSFMAPQAAEEKWQELRVIYKRTLARASHQVYVPNRGSGSTLFRLRAGPYNNAGDAVNACETIKTGGGLCAVVREQ